MRDGKMADNIVEPCENNPSGSVNDLSEEAKKEAYEFKEKANEYFKSGYWNCDGVSLFVNMCATLALVVCRSSVTTPCPWPCVVLGHAFDKLTEILTTLI